MWVLFCARTSLGGPTSCVFAFSQRIRHRRLVFPGVGPPCVLTKFSVPSHTCFCVSILGSANGRVAVDGPCQCGLQHGGGEQHVSTIVQGSLGVFDVLTDIRERTFCCVAMTFSGAPSCLHDVVIASALLSGHMLHRC